MSDPILLGGNLGPRAGGFDDPVVVAHAVKTARKTRSWHDLDEVLETLLPELAARGIRVVPVSTLMEIEGAAGEALDGSVRTRTGF